MPRPAPVGDMPAAAEAHAALAINHRGAAYLRIGRASSIPQESHLNPNSSSPFALAINLNDMEDLHFGHCGCGGKGAMLMHPSYVDRIVAFQPFPARGG